MHTAAKEGQEYTVQRLVELGADINIKDFEGVRLYYLHGIDFNLS